MVFTEKRLGQAQISSASNTTLYTVPSSKKAVAKDFIITNTTSTDATVSLWLVPNGDSSADGNAVLKDFNIPANEIVHLSLYQVLETAGDTIQALAGTTTSITITISGAEI